LIAAEALKLDMPSLVEAAKKQKTAVIVIGDHPEDGNKYNKLGANAVIYRNISGPALLECVRKVGKGENWSQKSETEALVNDNDAVGARVRDRLTPKELKIVALIVQGYKNKEIAVKLGTTEQVIKNYLRNVYDKIGVSDRLELALFTIHHKILLDAASATGVS
jgi:DNA-binding NarL/FixJ family response regulator